MLFGSFGYVCYLVMRLFCDCFVWLVVAFDLCLFNEWRCCYLLGWLITFDFVVVLFCCLDACCLLVVLILVWVLC